MRVLFPFGGINLVLGLASSLQYARKRFRPQHLLAPGGGSLSGLALFLLLLMRFEQVQKAGVQDGRSQDDH